MKVGDVMTKHVLSVKPADSIASAIHMMLKTGISGLPVIDAGGKLVEIERQPWNPRGLANVIVRRGGVTLAGVIFDEREREALRIAAENIPGVKKIRDRFVWMEPVSGALITSRAAAPARRGRKHAAEQAK